MEHPHPIRITTHDGSFHADDVLAVALLSTIYPNHCVTRTRDPDIIEWSDIVVDVGGIYDHTNNRYDHHMANPPGRGEFHLYSSAGLIWRHFGRVYLDKIKIPSRFVFEEATIDLTSAVEQHIRNQWIEPIDRVDNGISNEITPLSVLVQSMRPIDPEKSKTSYDKLFLEAVAMSSHIFQRSCFHAADFVIAQTKHIYSEKTFLHDNKIVICQHNVPSYRSYIGTDVHFVIMPSTPCEGMESHYIIRPVPMHQANYAKTEIPKMLLGARYDGIEKITGITGISYIHHNGFLAHAESEEAAIRFCEFCLGVATTS